MRIMIAERRENLNLTQEQLAQELKTDRSTVAKWETGKSAPRIEMMIRLAEVLKCTPNDLLGFGEGNKTEQETT